MQELIEKLKNNHGLSAEQAHGILNTIKDFAKEKFPMIGGAIDNVFPSGSNTDKGTDTDIAQAVTGATSAGDTGDTEGPAQKGGSFLDTVSDVPGEEGEKEKQAAKDKVDGFFEGNKKDY